MSADPPETTEPPDPALEGLVRALTADGTADELAARPTALAMFRDSRRRPRRLRSALSISTAAAAITLAGGITAAYAAVLPAPVQHIAYRVLGSIGVPDTHRTAPPASAARPVTSIPPTPSAPASARCPCPASRPGAEAGPTVVLAAAQAQIPAGGAAVLTGRVAPGGRPEAGVRVRLFERLAGRPGWRAASEAQGRAVTDSAGDVTWTVPHLTGDVAFRLAVPGARVSQPVLVTVIPAVHLGVAKGQQPDMAVLTARAPFAQAGDAVVLQERSGGIWYRVAERVLGPGQKASFRVLIPQSGGVEYRVILPRTTAHGSSASGPVRIASRSRVRVRPGRRAPP